MRNAHLFWQKVRKSDGCWTWVGATTGRGYGVVVERPRRMVAHRYAWEITNGRSVPGGTIVMHTCDNRLCVRPDHLRLGTQSENIKDMWDKGRAGNKLAVRTECSRGHSFDAANTGRDASGARVCRACRRTNALARYHKTKKLKRVRSS